MINAQKLTIFDNWQNRINKWHTSISLGVKFSIMLSIYVGIETMRKHRVCLKNDCSQIFFAGNITTLNCMRTFWGATRICPWTHSFHVLYELCTLSSSFCILLCVCQCFDAFLFKQRKISTSQYHGKIE